MHRRGLMQGLATALAGTFAAGGRTDSARAAAAPASVEAEAQGMAQTSKVAYHLCDLDKVNMALANIRNHYQGMDGEAITIRLVVIGPALKAFYASSARPDVKQQLAELRNLGLSPAACANTMRAQNITPKDLLAGFASAERGGVVELAELQRQGFAYIRP